MARVVLVACLALVGMLVLASSGTQANDSDFYEIGDEWVYDMTMEMDPVTLTGTMTYSVDGIKTETVAGVVYDVYDIGADCTLSLTGEYLTTTIEGTAIYTGRISVDVEELDAIRSDLNISMLMTFEGGLLIVPYESEWWAHTITTYSPPGGVGEEPDGFTEGVTWVMTYTVHTETMTYDDGDISSESESSTETRTCTCIGTETITVPAGTFDCEVVQVDDGDSIETNWYCEEVGNDVKSVYESGDGDGSYVLRSYSFTPKDSDSDNLMLYIAVGAVVVAIAVVTVIAMMLRKKPDAPQVVPSEPVSAQGPLVPPDQPPGTSPPPPPR
jgi:hypothetical protein